MKRPLASAFTLLGLISCLSAEAQAQDPVAAAAREEAADNYRTLSAKVSRLEEDLHTSQSQAKRLVTEIDRLRDEVERLKNRNENAATLEKISRLQDAIKQVDDARMEDNKRVLAEITRLRTYMEKAFRTLAATPAPPPDEPRHETAPPRNNPAPKPSLENSYKYTVKRGDTLSGIVTALRAQGYRVTNRQIEEANPGVNWSRLADGREIIIPPPSP
jgi:nucleoid-associated protein YgaU